MSNAFLIVLAAALLAAPLALAHEPRGTPKNYCEPTSEWSVHEYGVLPLTRHNGGGVGCGSLGDGHAEYDFTGAGALILAESGTGLPSQGGSGSLYCYGTWADHAPYGPATVDDLVLGSGAAFDVAADTVDVAAVGNGCGDFQDDVLVSCIGTCTVPFPPGLDGAYRVYVQGTRGHAIW